MRAVIAKQAGGPEVLQLADSPLAEVAEQVHRDTIPGTLAHTFDVADIKEAHRLMDSGTAVGKIVVTF